MIFMCVVLVFSILQEDQRKREEKDERKRKYNVRWNDQVWFFPCHWLIILFVIHVLLADF